MNNRSMVKSKCHMKYGYLNVWQSICLWCEVSKRRCATVRESAEV